MLDNNEQNRKKAQVVSHKSFDGEVGEISESVTKSVSQNNTIEFGMDIDTKIAGSLGFDIAGNGYSGGVTANFKIESGNSETNTNTQAITTGYTLKDNNVGDRFSVDVKTDPVYGTPVFDLLGGKASCPPEAAALPRDDVQLSVTNPIATNVANNAEAQFTLKIGNISQVNTDASRTVYLSLVPTSNPDGAIISINGSPYIAPLPYNVNRLGEVQVTVRVAKSAASSVFAYEGLRFQVTDACGSKALQAVKLSVFFQTTCSSISLLSPETNWVSTQANNNSVPHPTHQRQLPTGQQYRCQFLRKPALLNHHEQQCGGPPTVERAVDSSISGVFWKSDFGGAIGQLGWVRGRCHQPDPHGRSRPVW